MRTTARIVLGIATTAMVATCAAPAQPPLAAAGVVVPVAAEAAPVAKVVVLDPGHSGRTTDAEGRLVPDGRGGQKACNTTGTETDAGYPEHAFNFDVVQRVAARLGAVGVTVVLTRLDDVGQGPCVDARGRAGEESGADAVVSIHGDGAPAAGHGFHVALSDPPLDPSQEAPAHALALAVRDAMRGAGFVDSTYLGREGLSPRSDLAGLNLATRPSVLVECGNMRNAEEAAVMTAPEGRERYAAALAAGIRAFLGV